MVTREVLVRHLVLSGLWLLMGACVSMGKARHMQASSQYLDRVQELSIQDELYAGLSNIFNYSVTLRTKDLFAAQIDFQAKAYQWSREEIQKARQKMFESLANESQFFVSFYTPDLLYNDLNESNSIWRVHVEVDGTRYETDIRKEPASFPRLHSLYPKHTPWSQAYIVRIALPIEQLQQAQNVRWIITGDLGVSDKSFANFSTSEAVNLE